MGCGPGPVSFLAVCHVLTRAGPAGPPPCTPTSLCKSLLREVGSGFYLCSANSRGQGLNVFHQGPQLMSPSPPVPCCLLFPLAHTHLFQKRGDCTHSGVCELPLNWGSHCPGGGLESRPYQHWDLGKFLDLGQLQFLIRQIQ